MKTIASILEFRKHQRELSEKLERERNLKLISNVRTFQNVNEYLQPITIWVADLTRIDGENISLIYFADFNDINTNINVGNTLVISKCNITYAQLLQLYFDGRMFEIFDNAVDYKIIENKGESITGDVIVTWSWEIYVGYCRNLKGLRWGCANETESELISGDEDRIFRPNESVLLKSKELEGLTDVEKLERITDELNCSCWKWNYFGTPDFETLAVTQLNIL